MIGIAAGVGVLAGVAFGVWGALAFVAFAVAACALRGTLPSLTGIVIVAILTTIGVARHSALVAAVPLDLAAQPDVSQLVVVSNPDWGSAYQQYVAAPMQDPSVHLCIVSRALPIVGIGDVISVTGHPGRARDEPLRIQRFLASRGCVASLFAESVRIQAADSSPGWTFGRIRRAFSESLRSLVPGDSGALLAGLVVGDDSALSSEREQAFTNSGTTHLTAVSGANLALIAGMLIALGRVSVGNHRLVWQAVTIGGIWVFALVTGAEAPAVRAAIVATIALLALRFGRRADFPTLILLAAAMMALMDPSQVNRLGFQLSVAASLALAVAMPALTGSGVTGTLAGVVSATAVAQIATLPLLLGVFGSVSAFSIPANVLVAPLAGAAMPLAGIAGLLGIANTALGEIAVAPAALAADLTIAIADRLGASWSSIAVGVPPVASSFVLAATCGCIIWLLAGPSSGKS